MDHSESERSGPQLLPEDLGLVTLVPSIVWEVFRQYPGLPCFCECVGLLSVNLLAILYRA